MSFDSGDFNDRSPDQASNKRTRGPALGNPQRRPRETTILDVMFFAGFGVGLLILIIVVANSRSTEWPVYELMMLWVARAAGLVMSGLAVLCLLGRTWQGADIHDVAPLTIPLLGGVLLTQASWSVALALGLIVSTALVCQCFGRRSSAAESAEEG